MFGIRQLIKLYRVTVPNWVDLILAKRLTYKFKRLAGRQKMF